MTATLQISTFSLMDDFGTFTGYTFGKTQSKWAKPYFTKDQADKVMAAWNGDAYLTAWYDVDLDAYFFASPDNSGDDEDCDQPWVFVAETHDIDGVPTVVYPIGHFGDNDNESVFMWIDWTLWPYNNA